MEDCTNPLWKVLLIVVFCVQLTLGGPSHSEYRQHRVSWEREEVAVFRRQETTSTEPMESSNTDLADFFSKFWFIFIVLAVFVVIVVVFVCACVVNTVRKRSHHSLEINTPSTDHPLRSVDEHSLPQQTTGSSSVVGESPISLSVGPTPIPSPQPSAASSQRSYYSQSGQRRRNHSFGHVSSSSDETIRASTTSLMSHASSSFGGHPRLLRTESSSSGERGTHYRHSGRHTKHNKTTSNPHIKVLSSSSPSSFSLQSMEPTQSAHSSHSGSTLVDVDVTVHLGAENDHETRKEIAAALAESARKLAQSAADFDQEDSYSHHGRRSSSQLSYRSSLQSRRQLFPTHSSSVSLSQDHTHCHTPLPTVSLDRPRMMETQKSHNTLPSRRSSLTRAPPSESPLRISQRSLNSDTNQGMTKLPAHMRVSRIHSLEDSPSSQQGISLDNLNGGPPPSLVLNPKTTLSNMPSFQVFPHPATASLDFSNLGQNNTSESLRFVNGAHTHGARTYGRNDSCTHLVESDHGISPDSGMGNGDYYVTGTESGSSTLRSSHIEKRDRLSRLSEKSIEHLNYDDSNNTSMSTYTETGTKRKSSQGLPISMQQKYSRSGSRGNGANTSPSDSIRQNGHTTELDSLAQGHSSSGSQTSSLEENSTASGYAATGSGSSVESIPIEIPSGHMQQQFSYPLEKLLSQPICYNIDSDSVNPLSVDPRGHHGSKSNRKNKSHSGLKICTTQTGYLLDSRPRTHLSENQLLGSHRIRPYHTNQSLGESRYQSGSVTVDV